MCNNLTICFAPGRDKNDSHGASTPVDIVSRNVCAFYIGRAVFPVSSSWAEATVEIAIEKMMIKDFIKFMWI